MKDFKYWDQLSKSEKLEEFSIDKTGLLWLKLKSIIRKKLVAQFLEFSEVRITSTTQSQTFIELFKLLSVNTEKSHALLDEFIRQVNKAEVESLNTEHLVSELYKLKNFDWVEIIKTH